MENFDESIRICHERLKTFKEKGKENESSKSLIDFSNLCGPTGATGSPGLMGYTGAIGTYSLNGPTGSCGE